MSFECLISQQCGITPPQFLHAIDIWLHNPHAVNRRILASLAVIDVPLACNIYQTLEYINALDISSMLPGDRDKDVDAAKLLNALYTFDTAAVASSERTVRLHVSKQLPRVPNIFSVGIEFTLIDNQENYMVSVHKPIFECKQPLGPKVAYTLCQESDGHTALKVHRSNNDLQDSSMEWLEKKLYPRIVKWAKSDAGNFKTPLVSLSFVSTEKYARLYCDLKEKYGTKLIRGWPENTDPLKFVYEDIAIATYLLLLWEKERSEKNIEKLQTFVDLGCGNGLLVYILMGEGHKGLGIDLRRRKIWDMYPADTLLQVSTIIPSSATVYPGIDWIIGNHSDELTPWIPVIAARSSKDCRFFLLPCCPYELNGAKYQRRYASQSQYSEYIDYVRNLCTECGFKTYIDKLRIPSTKRICLIGWDRVQEEVEEREERIQDILNAKAVLISEEKSIEPNQTANNVSRDWKCNFKPRETTERVRNCTQLNKDLVTKIIGIVSKQLLHEGRLIPIDGTPGKTWNAGRCLELRELVESIPKEVTICLRRECGGLQTLLKNHSHIFHVAQGKVEFKIPGVEEVNQTRRRGKASQIRKKTKPCWFYENHPNGCPALDATCNFKHQQSDR